MRLSCHECAAETTVATLIAGDLTCPSCGGPLSTSEEDSDRTRSFFDSAGPGATREMPPPDRIGKYRVLERVAAGGCGVVYKARDDQLGLEVAIKIPRVDSDGETARQLLSEARTMARLRHPNIVRVITADRDEQGQVFVVMEWVEGKTLRDAISEGLRSQDEVLLLMEKVADAVHAAHKAGFVHRDLKPSNVLLGGDGEPLVSDFGLAVDEESQFERRGEFAGTVSYMSPEQVRREAQFLDGRADVWALGVMLYEMLGGRRPFRGDREQILDEICQREPKPLTLLNEQVGRELADIVSGCLHKDVAGRTATAGLLRDRLKRARLRREQRRGVPVAALIAVAAVVLIALSVGLPLLLSNSLSLVDRGGDAEPPAEGPRELVPGRWNKLLDRPLEVLHEPAPENFSRFDADAELEMLTVSVNQDEALLRAGETDARDFQVSVLIDQPGWRGGFGLFYGLRPDDREGYWCEVIALVRSDDEYGRPSYRLDRFAARLDGSYRMTERYGHSSEPVMPPGKKHELRLVVQEGLLRNASFGKDAVLQRLVDERHPHLPVTECAGGFGFLVTDCTVTFTQLRIFVERDPP